MKRQENCRFYKQQDAISLPNLCRAKGINLCRVSSKETGFPCGLYYPTCQSKQPTASSRTERKTFLRDS